tara:strand:- start:762 stop:1265 length:504 start_codon:yes stop_codon:yes gene_type:complete
MKETRLIMESWRRYLSEAIDWESEAERTVDATPQIDTVGQLRNILDKVILAKRGKGGLRALKDVGISAVADLIPAANTAKSLFDVFQATYNLPDGKRTNTGLDKLNVDDQVSKVVDDTVENMFLQDMKDKFEGLPDDTRLEDLDMTKLLSKYISDEFEKTVVAGAEK